MILSNLLQAFKLESIFISISNPPNNIIRLRITFTDHTRWLIYAVNLFVLITYIM